MEKTNKERTWLLLLASCLTCVFLSLLQVYWMLADFVISHTAKALEISYLAALVMTMSSILSSVSLWSKIHWLSTFVGKCLLSYAFVVTAIMGFVFYRDWWQVTSLGGQVIVCLLVAMGLTGLYTGHIYRYRCHLNYQRLYALIPK